MLVAGVAFKKTFSYAGFEMQRKQYEKPLIALLNVELELKAEKENAEVRVDNVQVIYQCKCRTLVDTCIKVVLTRKWINVLLPTWKLFIILGISVHCWCRVENSVWKIGPCTQKWSQGGVIQATYWRCSHAIFCRQVLFIWREGMLWANTQLLRARFNKNSFQRGSCNDVHSRWSSEKLTWRQCLMALLSLTVLILIVIWLDGFTCLAVNFNYWIIIWRMSNYKHYIDDLLYH